MAEKIAARRILVTGGAGFIGSNLCLHLKGSHPSWEIFALDNLRRSGSELNLPRLAEAGVCFVHGDIRNAEDLDTLADLDAIVDASADPSVLAGIRTPVKPLLNSNLVGTINCLELAVKCNALFLFLSTSRVYPIRALESLCFEERPTRFQWSDEQTRHGASSKGVTEEFTLTGARSFYGASKLCCELLIAEYHQQKSLRTVINRCGVVAGPWQMGKVDQGVLSLWVARHFFKKSLSYVGYGGTGKQLRDVLHVQDLCNLIAHQLRHPELYNGEVWNAGGGLDVSFSLQELTAVCREVTGNRVLVEEVSETREADIRIYVSDCGKLHNRTGWGPQKNLRQIVSDTFDWMRENENDLRKILL